MSLRWLPIVVLAGCSARSPGERPAAVVLSRDAAAAPAAVDAAAVDAVTLAADPDQPSGAPCPVRRLRPPELTHGEATFQVEGPVTYTVPRPPPSAISEWERSTIDLFACGQGAQWLLVAHVVSSRSDQWHEIFVHEGQGHPGWLMITRHRDGFSIFGARLQGRGGAPLDGPRGWMTFAVAFDFDPMIDGLRRKHLDDVPDEVEARFLRDEPAR